MKIRAAPGEERAAAQEALQVALADLAAEVLHVARQTALAVV